MLEDLILFDKGSPDVWCQNVGIIINVTILDGRIQKQKISTIYY